MASFDRWMKFNAVGLVGVGVQLVTLAFLTRVAGIHYLPATLVGVEAAILHNFLWHQRWTWSDRPCLSIRSKFLRLFRFHLTNGLISLGGNVVLMGLLVEQLGAPVLVANLISIVLCSLINFAASHYLVFGLARRRPPSQLHAGPDSGFFPDASR